MEFSSNQLSIANFIPSVDNKPSSSITSMEQLQLAFLALAHTIELLFGFKLASILQSKIYFIKKDFQLNH